MNKTRRLTLLSIFVAQALVLSIVESWIPLPFMIPGVKLGLANIVTLIVIVFFGWKDALAVVIVRCILSSIFGGGFVMFFFSLAGGILSTFVMAFLYRKMSKVFSLIGVSVAGSVAHNIGQLIVASFVMKELTVLSYLPVLLVSGVIMGCIIGFSGNLLTKSLGKVEKFI